jgi:hypothetical protein
MRRIAFAAISLAAMAFAILVLLEVSASGVPDGYVTPYDVTTETWAAGMAFATLIAGIFALVAAAFDKRRRALAGVVIAALLALSLYLLQTCPRLDWCAAAVQQLTGQMLDDGQGG